MYRSSAEARFQSTLPSWGATAKLGQFLEPQKLISIHAPLMGSDSSARRFFQSSALFQSTLPSRGATAASVPRGAASDHFNPRSPHGERRFSVNGRRLLDQISIHAPLTGSDRRRSRIDFANRPISIHAPLTGSDLLTFALAIPRVYFNPRSPHGERQAE